MGEGTWFVATDNGYQVVDAPTEGATIIEELPEENKKIEVANQDFFFADNKWYMPVEGGYMLIEEPVAIQKETKAEEKATATETKADTTSTSSEASAVPATRGIESASKVVLPADAKEVEINGKKYYFANSTWYDKTANGDYVIVESPLK